MVELETVLVLGAGASKDFGFPTGKKLVKEIYTILDNKTGSFFELFYETAGRYSPEMAEKFPDVLKQANPFSVDAWLEHNPTYIEVGKIAIAIALLNYENRSILRPDNNWYQLLFKRLDIPFEQFENNRLSIITFNYDRSLEQYLFETFRYTHAEKSKEKCKEKLNQLQIVHVYGSLGCLEWQFGNPKYSLPQVPYGTELERNNIFSAAVGIEIIPEKTPKLSQKFREARILITHAKALYFLGFGYNRTNMERLGIDALHRPPKIMGTAYGLDYQRIKEIERLNIHAFTRKFGLVNKPVYEFLWDYVDFNEDSLPDIFLYQKTGK